VNHPRRVNAGRDRRHQRVVVDGNKRLGWLSTAVLLEINGIQISSADNESVRRLVIEAAAAHKSVDGVPV
jgi:death-on-curing protein